MQLSSLIDDVQDQLRVLKSRLLPRQVLLELRDDHLIGQALRDAGPGPVTIDVPLPALTCRGGMPLEQEPLGDLIGDLLVRDELLEACVLAALPPTASEWRVVVWPFDEMPDEPVEALRQLDPPLRLTTPLQDCTIDLHPLPGTPAQMLLSAAPRSLVEAWIEVFNLAGARLDRLAPAQSCQLAALHPLLDRAPRGQLTALLDPLPEGCRLVLFRSHQPVFERLLPTDDGTGPVDELVRCLAFYRRQDPAARELRLLMTAPMACQDALERALGLEGELLRPEPWGSLVLQGLATPEPTP